MEGPFLSPPGKRRFHNLSTIQDINATATTTTTTATNGASKRRSKPPPPPIVLSPGQVSFRLLCHVSTIGGVIGKSGSIIKLFQQETGAKIRIEEPITSCEERIVLIVASENPKKKIRLKGFKDESEEESSGEEYEASPAQETLIRVFERVLEVEAESEGVFPPLSGMVSCRLLAESSQVGSVMGKGGKKIEKIRKDSGAKIRVLSAEQLPSCAGPTDEVIQVMGDILAVKKAALAISQCLQDCPPLDKAQMVGSRPVMTVPHVNFTDPRVEHLPPRNSLLQPTQLPTLGSSFDYAPRGHPVSSEIDRISTLDPKKTQQEVSFRLLCSNDKIGGVIGKGGSIVRALQTETGASISVGASVAESDERVITVSALENPESQYSPAQNAVVHVFTRSVEAGIEKGLESGSNTGSSVSARLLVPSNQVGCLIGKGGTIVSEMRKATGAGIRIVGGDQVPKCSSENEDVVQIVGKVGNVQDALFHVTSRLRDSLFPSKTLNGAGAGSYSSSTIPGVNPQGRVREPTSPGLYPSVSLSHSLDRRTSLMHGMDHYGFPQSLDRPPSPRLWPSQTMGGGNSRGISDIGRGLTTLKGGLELGSGSKTAIVTNTTVEIVVPEHVIEFVYGENGSNLSRLRQISGAKVIVHEPRPGTSERMVIISGTPDQTQAAQSLLHAFILSGQS